MLSCESSSGESAQCISDASSDVDIVSEKCSLRVNNVDQKKEFA